MSDKVFKQLFKLSDQNPGVPGFLGEADVVNKYAENPELENKADWNSAIIAKEKHFIAEDIAAVDVGDSRKKALEHILTNTGRYELSDNPRERLRSYIYGVSSLIHAHQHGGMSETQINQMFEVSQALINTSKIEKNSSKLGYLYNDLYLAKSLHEQKSGDHWNAIISQQIGHYLGKRQPSGGQGFQALIAAFSAFRLGHASTAAMGFLVAEEMPLSKNHFEFARINRIKAMRIAQEHQNARQLITETLNLNQISEELHLELTWEEALLNATIDGDFAPIFSMTLRGKPHYQPGYLIEAHLWARGLSSQAFIKRLPKLATIKKMAGSYLLKSSPQTALFDAAFVLDECYKNSVPLELRLANAAQVLNQVKNVIGFDGELLIKISYARWFHRFHQQYLAAIALNEYQGSSLIASRGISNDSFRVAQDLRTDAWSRFIPASKMDAFANAGSQEKMITSPISRAYQVSKMTLSIATSLASTKLKTMTLNQERSDAVWSEHYKNLGTKIVQNLGKLKGPMMKVAQSISYLPSQLPEEIRDEMSKLQHSAKPLSGEAARKIIESEYKQPLTEIFSEWSNEPFAAGSIGQVHKARLKNGDRVAVKLMYPNIAEMVESDMRTIKLITPLTKKMFPYFDLKRILDEYHKMLLQECDYRNEAMNQERFRDMLRDYKSIIVPRVYKEYSTSQVLVSEYVEGLTLKEFVRTASQEERNSASAIIFETAFASMVRLGVFNADPHPGNYLFAGNKVVLLDFGFVQSWPERMMQLVRRMHFAVLNNELETFKQLAIEIGWIGDVKNYNFEYQLEVARVYNSAAFLEDKPFRFTKEHNREEIEAMVTLNPNAKLSSYPIDLIAIDRLTWGINSVLAQLEGEANYYQILKLVIGDPEDFKSKTIAS